MSGTVALIVGPSGAGKDTLIAGAAAHLAGDGRFVFPRRLITRPADAGGEDHIAVTARAFEDSEKAGAFALSWRAHGLAYGIPGTVADDLQAGRVVVVNVSRGVIGEARRRFGRVAVVMVSVPREILLQRLSARGRESAAEIAARLERADTPAPSGEVLDLVNDGSPAEGIARLVALLRPFADPA